MELGDLLRETLNVDCDEVWENERTPTLGVVCKRVEHLESFYSVMKNNRRGLLVKHLSGGELDQAIADAQKADENREFREIVLKFAVSNIEQLCEPL